MPTIPIREICGLCHRVSPISFWVPNELWAEVVHPHYIASIHCLTCFITRADEKMVAWERDIKFYPVSKRSHLDGLEPVQLCPGCDCLKGQCDCENCPDRNAPQCHDCGLAYGSPAWIEAVVPNNVWSLIAPKDGEGLLCITCMALRCVVAGLQPVRVKLTAGAFVVDNDPRPPSVPKLPGGNKEYA